MPHLRQKWQSLPFKKRVIKFLSDVRVRRRPRLLLMEVQSRLVGISIGSRTNRWREALEQQAGKVFETPQEDKRELKQLKAQNERLLHKVGQLTIDCDFLAQACEDAGLKVK